MHTETAARLPASSEQIRSVVYAPPRLWQPLLLVALYWAAAVAVGQVDKPYFYGFVYAMASAGLLTLVFFVWWWTRRAIRLRDRLLGFVLVIAGGLIMTPLCDPSVGKFGLAFTGMPMALTAWALWMLLARTLTLSPAGLGALAVVWLTWSSLALIRVDGVSGDLQGDYRWRWSPSAEDLFQTELAARMDAASETPDSEQVASTDGDWIAFRGPMRDGVIRGVNISADWSAKPPRQVWRQRVGPGWSSVIVVGDRLFTQEQRGENEAVICYDAQTGKQQWVHEDRERFWETVSGAGPRATPTFAAGRLYTLGAKGMLNCLDAATGKRHWSREVTQDAGGQVPMWGFANSPLVVDGLVVVYGGKALLAYKVETGEPAWSADVGGYSYSSPQLTTVAGKPQILFLAERGLIAMDPATGELLWEHGVSMPGAPRSVQAHLMGKGQLVVGTMSGNGVARIDVTRDSVPKANELWSTNQLNPEFPDFVVHEGHAYGLDSGVFCCIELESGTRRWKGGRYGRGQVMLLADQPALLVLTEKGQAILLAANPERREERGRFQALAGKTWNHPVIAHRSGKAPRLYVRNAAEMACYDVGGK
jgi:outer membrane protein assembly factor BamB